MCNWITFLKINILSPFCGISVFAVCVNLSVLICLLLKNIQHRNFTLLSLQRKLFLLMFSHYVIVLVFHLMSLLFCLTSIIILWFSKLRLLSNLRHKLAFSWCTLSQHWAKQKAFWYLEFDFPICASKDLQTHKIYLSWHDSMMCGVVPYNYYSKRFECLCKVTCTW